MLVIPWVTHSGGEGCGNLLVSVSLGFSMGTAVGKVRRTLRSRAGGETGAGREGQSQHCMGITSTANKQIK